MLFALVQKRLLDLDCIFNLGPHKRRVDKELNQLWGNQALLWIPETHNSYQSAKVKKCLMIDNFCSNSNYMSSSTFIHYCMPFSRVFQSFCNKISTLCWILSIRINFYLTQGLDIRFIWFCYPSFTRYVFVSVCPQNFGK